MLFFESKYYVPIVTPTEHQLEDRDPKYTSLLLNKHYLNTSVSGSNLGAAALEQYCTDILLGSEWELDVHKIITEFEAVTDLTHVGLKHVSHDKRMNAIFKPIESKYNVWYDQETECFVSVVVDEDRHVDHSAIHAPLTINRDGVITTFALRGYLKRRPMNNTPEIGILTQSSHGFSIRFSELSESVIDLERMYSGDFKSVSDDILGHTNDEDKTGLILLHGLPGTGKTSYIRWLSGQSNRRFVFIPPEVVSSLATPAFAEFLMRHTGLTFIVEDAEATLRPRMGSEGSIVTTILNLTDGLMGDILKCQFICTFNTGLEDVDSALLRPGRLLVRHEFGKLSISEVSELLDSRNIDIQVDEPKTLAEVLNIESMPTVTKQEPKRSFGFTSVA